MHCVLPVSEYACCELAWQMPGGLELFVQRAFSIWKRNTAVKDTKSANEATAMRCWEHRAYNRGIASSDCCGFLGGLFYGSQAKFLFDISFTCVYSPSLCARVNMRPCIQPCRRRSRMPPFRLPTFTISIPHLLSGTSNVWTAGWLLHDISETTPLRLPVFVRDLRTCTYWWRWG